jgi:hypothetical protein
MLLVHIQWPVANDSARLIQFIFIGLEKTQSSGPTHFCRSAIGMQTRPKFGCSLCRHGQTAVSARILVLLPKARISLTAVASSPAPHRVSGLHRERLTRVLPILRHHQWCHITSHLRFQLCAVINSLGRPRHLSFIRCASTATSRTRTPPSIHGHHD